MGLLSLHATMAMVLSLVAIRGTGHVSPAGPMDRLLDAIATVESRSDPAALGDAGRAAGVYQIHRSYWADAIRILGVNWQYGEANNPQKAREVVRAYLCHYGSGKTLLEMARIHNGGPRGCEKASTLPYARKIAQVLNDDL